MSPIKVGVLQGRKNVWLKEPAVVEFDCKEIDIAVLKLDCAEEFHQVGT